ncbi:hypothetical protein [Oxynema aestuarii]|jgi:hypothetical protein|uniref:Uncharacterized protein n=1 Tax=Oxynema aestuarii AP17 TaxID=2064643 RepID=A0A6H1TU49_9CYAN|nr:hypothetical protein [Oxynema aestuarii]QIZ69677.1 hypothetical protein HCG48_03010 [Oxynema aestuarii AP17]RMH77805.1 MAG: hypothetical protein D6680_04220 [Cyanobacteria bacterium J007]
MITRRKEADRLDRHSRFNRDRDEDRYDEFNPRRDYLDDRDDRHYLDDRDDRHYLDDRDDRHYRELAYRRRRKYEGFGIGDAIALLFILAIFSVFMTSVFDRDLPKPTSPQPTPVEAETNAP